MIQQKIVNKDRVDSEAKNDVSVELLKYQS